MREVPGYKGIWVDDNGEVWIKPKVHYSEGYLAVKHQKLLWQRVHVLVALAYHGPCPFAGAEVRHLDGDRRNNRPDNLVWGSRAENCQDTTRHGRHYTGAKVTPKQVKEIVRRRKAGEAGKSLAEEFGISQQRVCDLLHGR